MFSAYKLNKQWLYTALTSFPIWNQSVVPCPILTVASWPAYRFLKRQVRWSGISISFRIFQFIVIHTVKGFGIVNKAEIDVFLELSWFLIIQQMLAIRSQGYSAFSKTSLNICKFTVHVLLKPGLENFEHYIATLYRLQSQRTLEMVLQIMWQWSTFSGLLELSLLALGKTDLVLGNWVRGANFRVVSSEGPRQGCLKGNLFETADCRKLMWLLYPERYEALLKG